MSNNGIVERKENFITKIKNFFNRLFKKNETQYDKAFNESISKQENYDILISKVNIDYNALKNITRKERFIKYIDRNEEALNKLSMERLKKLTKYYDTVIEENERKIKELKVVQ